MGNIPMKNTEADEAVAEGAKRVAQAELRAFVERIERLLAERQDINSEIAEVKAEAKARGYDVKGINHVIKVRKKDRDQYAEEQAVNEMYEQALGL